VSREADLIVDRRNLMRSLARWRIVAVIAIALALGALAAFSLRSDDGQDNVGLFERQSGFVARVQISGFIRINPDRVRALEALAKSNARAVIVQIDSTGGSVAGSEQLYEALRKVAAVKPTVAVINGVGASGAYAAAVATEEIFALSSSIVGSIGVIAQFPNASELLKNLGVGVEAYRSAPLKASPSGVEPTSEEAKAAMNALVRSNYEWFRALVKERRGLNDAETDRVADGRVFTGRQAVDLKLVDRLGDEATARDWLASEKKIDRNLPVRDWRTRPRTDEFSFLSFAGNRLLTAFGLPPMLSGDAGEAVERLHLDGLMAVWQPPLTN
jgi:protease-4